MRWRKINFVLCVRCKFKLFNIVRIKMNTNFTWNIEPFDIKKVLELIEDKKLILRPEYQRRSVWSKPAKAALIETIMQKKPIPLFLIQKKSSERFEVIDGQQRLRAILDFYKDKLQLVKVDDEINGKFFSDFEDSLIPEIDYKKIFKNYQLYFNLVESANEDEIIDMYSRVNKYTVNLNKMEMRYSLSHDTEIMKFIESLAEDESNLEFFLKSGIFTQSNMARMGDIEFLTQLISYILKMEFMNKDESITDLFSEYSEISEDFKSELKNNFDSTLNIIKLLFIGEEFKNYNELDSDETVTYYLKNSRFKQKNDFLSLFCTLYTIKDSVDFTRIDAKLLAELRNFLIFMDFEVAPQSDIDITSEYGVKCVSQANTKSSREYRSKFILEGINYIFENDFYSLFSFALNPTLKEVSKLNVIENLFSNINRLYELESTALSISPKSTFKDILNILWDDEDASKS